MTASSICAFLITSALIGQYFLVVGCANDESTVVLFTVKVVIYAELPTICVKVAVIEASISPEEISSVHLEMKLLISGGIRDRKSASLFAFQGLYFMQKLKSASEATHLCPLAGT